MPNTYPRHAPTLYLGPTHTRYYCESCDRLRSESEVDEHMMPEGYVATLCDVCGNEVEYHDDVPVDDDGNELEDEEEEADDDDEEGDDDEPVLA